MIVEILLIILVSFIIAALPLYFAVKFFGGKTSLFKTIGVNILSALVLGLISTFVPFASIIGFIVLIWIYREFFRLRWIKAFLVWLLQLVLTAMFLFLGAVLLGVSLFI